jgi:uncharacterized membrane protein YphA (DoxX/SURF4 family)
VAIGAGEESAGIGVALQTMLGAAAVALAAGVLTPVAGVAIAVAVAGAAAGVGIGVPMPVAESLRIATPAIATALLGPGAYSIDARWFGRREIVVSHAPRR